MLFYKKNGFLLIIQTSYPCFFCQVGWFCQYEKLSETINCCAQFVRRRKQRCKKVKKGYKDIQTNTILDVIEEIIGEQYFIF